MLQFAILTILCLAAVGAIITVLILNARKTNNTFQPSSKNRANSQQDTISIDQANRHQRQKLLRILHNDRDAANRLLAHVKRKNPNRSIDWCVEKVIFDLKRDRGRY